MNYCYLKFIKVSCLFLLLLFIGCDNDDNTSEPEATNENKIESIGFAENSRFKFEYFKKFTLIKSQTLIDNAYEDTSNGFETRTFDGKLEIRYSTGLDRQGPLFMNGLYNDQDQLIEVKRFFGNGAEYIYNLDYLSDAIRITLRFDSDGADGPSEPKIIEFGDYKLDAQGNVVETLKYANLDTSSTEDDLYERSTYQYDTANNNWKGQAVFFFGWQTLPNSRFLSPNNITTQNQKLINDTPKEFQFRYTYDSQGRTTEGFTQWFPINGEGKTESYSYLEE